VTISRASRAASSSAPDYAEQILDEVRQRIAAEKWVLDETRARRNKVLAAAKRFDGALRTFPSGSLAHGTVNNPISDGGGGLVLNRVSWPSLGPDGGGEGPTRVMRLVAEFVAAALRPHYPRRQVDLSGKRAIVFHFHEPMDDEDPSVDLMVCLTRRDAAGFWIPNTKRASWDPSDSETHTRLMTAEPARLRVHRAQVIRLAKAAINGHDEDQRALIPWNISAEALSLIRQVGKRSVSLAAFFADLADAIESGPTPDPAGVSAPIKLPDGVKREQAVRRLRFFAHHAEEAVAHRDDHQRALAAWGEVFPKQLPEAPRSAASQHADLLRSGSTGTGVASVFGSTSKTYSSFGDALA
jgi:hypothetical protein